MLQLQLLGTSKPTCYRWALWTFKRGYSVVSIITSLLGTIKPFLFENIVTGQSVYAFLEHSMCCVCIYCIPLVTFNNTLSLLAKIIKDHFKRYFSRIKEIDLCQSNDSRERIRSNRQSDDGIMVKVLLSCYYIHFQNNILGKSMDPLIFSALG